MASLDTIRTITVRGRTEGIDATINKLKQLSGATNEVAQVSEKTSRSALSVENAIERQRRSLDTTYRAQQIFNKGQRERDLGLAQGVLSLTEYNRLNGLAKQRFDEMTGAVDKSAGAFDRFGNMLTKRVVLAVAVMQVKELVRWIVQLNSELAKTGDVANRTGIGGQQFQGIGTAAGYKGIGSGQIADDMLKFNTQVDRAKSGLGDLNSLFRANGISAKSTEDAYFKVADLVRDARSEADKFSILQQAGLPATLQNVRFMEQGASAIRAQAEQARKLTNEQLEQARILEDRWHKGWTDFTRWGKQAILDVGATMSRLGDPFAHEGTMLGGLLKRMGVGVAADPHSPQARGADLLRQGMGTPMSGADAKSFYDRVQGKGGTNDPEKARELLSLEQQRLGLLGNIASVDEIIAAKNKEILLSNTGITEEQRKQILARERIQAQSSRLEYNLQFEREQIGRSPTEQRVASELRGAGVDPLSQQGQFLANQIRINEQLRFTNDLGKDALKGFASDLMNGVSALEAMRNALGRVAQKLMDMAVDNLWSSAFGGGKGGGFNFLSLFGGGGGGAGPVSVMGGNGPFAVPTFMHSGGLVGRDGSSRGFVHAAYFENAPRFRTGGIAGLGPDEVPIIAHDDEEIITRRDPRHRRNGGGAGGDSFTYAPTFNDVTPDLLPKIEARLQMFGQKWKNEVFADMKKRRRSDPGFYGA